MKWPGRSNKGQIKLELWCKENKCLELGSEGTGIQLLDHQFILLVQKCVKLRSGNLHVLCSSSKRASHRIYLNEYCASTFWQPTCSLQQAFLIFSLFCVCLQTRSPSPQSLSHLAEKIKDPWGEVCSVSSSSKLSLTRHICSSSSSLSASKNEP